MLVLDTDHISMLGESSAVGLRLLTRLRDAREQVVTTAITVEESLHGWLQFITRSKTPQQLMLGYSRLLQRVEFFADWTALNWDEASSQLFFNMRSIGVRIGTHDLRIASIVLSHDATLLTRNAVDIERVPNLKFENWLD